MTTGERIKEARIRKGLTQEELGKMIGVQRAAINKYESGAVINLKRTTISKLANALGVKGSWLICADDEEEPHPASVEASPTITDDVVSVPILGDVAAGYDHIADATNMVSEQVDIPRAWLHGRPLSDFFALRVVGSSMYPLYIDGDIVIVLRQSTLNRSGEIGVVVYADECATLKKVEYVMGEDWMRLIPINPSYEPILVQNEELEHCRVLGIPKMLIRRIKE